MTSRCLDFPSTSLLHTIVNLMNTKNRYSVQDALNIITGDDSEFEGCQVISDQDPEDPDYTPSSKDMENDESNDVPQPDMSHRQQSTSIQGKQKSSWRKKPFEAPECTFKGQIVTPPDKVHTPLEYFRKFIAEMLQLLMEQSNLYSVQKSKCQSNVNTTVKQILIGLYLRMGLCQFPGNDTRCSMVADMSRNHFQTVLSCLHFTDNTDFPIRQYVKGKSHPWGLKIWGRCTSSGILCDFTVYEGGTEKKTLLDMGGDVEHSGNRLASCQLEDKSLAKKGRGSVDSRVEKEDNIVIVRWYDSKSVTMISSYSAIEPQDKVNRPHIVKEYNTFMRGIDLLSACIARYKYHMRLRRWYLYLFWQTIMLGLVGAWLIYRCDCRLLGVQKTLKQRSFQAEVANSLIFVHSQRGHPSLKVTPSPPPPKRVRVRVPDDVRTDQAAHWPVKCDKRGHCKVCKVNATTTLCEKCDARLCFFEERSCFKPYHLA
uniref:PiggyBac transposable element-derived protein domain-containing protein n=1 Tax=Electrophorus electricus TaxID=8005 RepID=A0A4W4FR38_ELEEL